MKRKTPEPGTVELSTVDLDQVGPGESKPGVKNNKGASARKKKKDAAAGKKGRSAPPGKKKKGPTAVTAAELSTTTGDLIGGKIIDGRYEVLERLGVGAMGTVFLVKHLRLSKLFALKVINPDLAEKPEFLARFEREAHACSRLHHPNCISVTDFGHTEDGSLFLVMEYVEGEALSDFARDTPTKIPEALEYTRQILLGLEHAHGMGLIHRDIKLENVLRCSKKKGDFLLKILDFGMAKPMIEDPESESITKRKTVLGTPQYLAPEQVDGKNVDERSDLYSVGICLYRMITGKIVFAGDTMLEMLRTKLKKPAPTLKDATGLDYPKELEAFIKKALRRDANKRFQTATEMLQQLEKVKAAVTGSVFPFRLPFNRKDKNKVLFVLGFAASMLVLLAIIRGMSSSDETENPPSRSRPQSAFAPGVQSSPKTQKKDNNPVAQLKQAANGQPLAVLQPTVAEMADEQRASDLHPVLLEAKLLIERTRCTAAREKLKGSLGNLGDQIGTGYFLLGRAHMCMGNPMEALAHYKKAIESDAQYRLHGIIAQDARKMLSMKRAGQSAMTFMMNVLGDAAMPTLIHVAGHHKNMDIRHQAREYVASSGMIQDVDMVSSLEWDLKQAPNCRKKRRIVNRLRSIGNSKAKQVLERARDAHVRKGLFRKEYIHQCVREHIIKAIAVMEKR